MTAKVFIVPAEIAGHRTPMVKAFLSLAHLIFADRDRLGVARLDRHGNVIRPALPFLLMRRRPSEKEKAFTRRRADHLQRILATVASQLAFTDYKSKAILEPDHERAKVDPYLSLRRLAEIAEIIPADYKAGDPGDGVQRVIQWEKRIGLISKTKQWREKNKKTGKHYSTGAALRRISFKVLGYFGGEVRRLANKALRKIRKAREEEEAAEKQFAAAVAEEDAARAAASSPGSPTLPPAAADGQPDEVETIMQETGMGWPEAIAEARRRRRHQRQPAVEGGADATGPPGAVG